MLFTRLAVIPTAHTEAQVAECVSDITSMWGLVSLRHSRQPGFAASSRMRLEVRPPSLRHKPSSPWQQLVFWLMAPAPMDSAPPLDRLPAVQAEFLNCLDDTAGDEACRLADRISGARSLRELWHLRAAVYGVVARQHNQAEAQVRVDGLNRHFPTRSPRSGFVPMLP